MRFQAEPGTSGGFVIYQLLEKDRPAFCGAPSVNPINPGSDQCGSRQTGRVKGIKHCLQAGVHRFYAMCRAAGPKADSKTAMDIYIFIDFGYSITICFFI